MSVYAYQKAVPLVLAKLTDEQFEAKLAAGDIHPEMERRDLLLAEKRERRAEREIELGAFQAALPDKRYGVVYADPAWEWEDCSSEISLDRGPSSHYPAMTLAQIKARDVPSIAAADCVLFSLGAHANAAGSPRCHGGVGLPLQDRRCLGERPHRHGLLVPQPARASAARRQGGHPGPAMGTQWPSLIEAPVRGHSRKPDEAYAIIESYFPHLPKIELFGRGPARPNWSIWGNEAETSLYRETEAAPIQPSLPALPEPGDAISAAQLEAIEQGVAAALPFVNDIAVAEQWRRKAKAIEAYLRSPGMQRPILGAQRRIEGQIGQLLNDAEPAP